MDLQEALDLHSKIGVVENLEDMISNLNKELDYISLEIIKKTNPLTGNLQIILRNTLGDEISKLATFNKENELAFFKLLIKEIVNSEFIYSSTSALSLCKLSKKDGEKVIDNWIKQGWLSEDEGKITFGPKTVFELGSYLTAEYEENLVFCSLCEELVLHKYEKCKSSDCSSVLHVHCAQKYYANSNDGKCIECQSSFY
jgi:hypothetical protein